jgi:hypothetical protein
MIRGHFRKGAGALALLALFGMSASADAKARRHRRAASAAYAPAFNAFTPAAADPNLAAAFANSGIGDIGVNDGAFRFTPSSGSGGSRRAITVAVRSRAFTRQQAAKAMGLPSDGLAPSAYSLGASIGWKRFALSGDMHKVDGGLLPTSRESADLGLIFSGKRWATELQLAGERAAGPHLPAIPSEESFSVGLGGSYALSHRFNLTGGVRYKQQREQTQSLTDDRRDSQAIYLGTTFKF